MADPVLEVPEHCEQRNCTSAIETWCPLCGRFLCEFHDELLNTRGHDCLRGPAEDTDG